MDELMHVIATVVYILLVVTYGQLLQTHIRKCPYGPVMCKTMGASQSGCFVIGFDVDQLECVVTNGDNQKTSSNTLISFETSKGCEKHPSPKKVVEEAEGCKDQISISPREDSTRQKAMTGKRKQGDVFDPKRRVLSVSSCSVCSPFVLVLWLDQRMGVCPNDFGSAKVGAWEEGVLQNVCLSKGGRNKHIFAARCPDNDETCMFYVSFRRFVFIECFRIDSISSMDVTYEKSFEIKNLQRDMSVYCVEAKERKVLCLVNQCMYLLNIQSGVMLRIKQWNLHSDQVKGITIDAAYGEMLFVVIPKEIFLVTLNSSGLEFKSVFTMSVLTAVWAGERLWGFDMHQPCLDITPRMFKPISTMKLKSGP